MDMQPQPQPQLQPVTPKRQGGDGDADGSSVASVASVADSTPRLVNKQQLSAEGLSLLPVLPKNLRYQAIWAWIQPPSNSGWHRIPMALPPVPQSAKPADNMPTTFPQFSKLPPELRRMIWRETWEMRDVMIYRDLVGTRNATTGQDNFADEGEHMDARDLRDRHVQIVRRDFGINLMTDDLTVPVHPLEHEFLSVTRSTARLPISLQVCRESRHETLRFYGVRLGLPPNLQTEGPTSVRINFNLDRVMYPLHAPLSTAFSLADMSRLRRICLPELSPTAPCYALARGPYGDGFFAYPRVPRDSAVRYQEFQFTWYLLRRYCPQLREIYLTPFHDCKRYRTTRHKELRWPLREEEIRGNQFTMQDVNNVCHACHNLQRGIDRNFPLYNEYKPPHAGHTDPDYAQLDMKRILERRNISKPVWRSENIVIGTVNAQRRGEEDEDVVVCFWVLCEGIHKPNVQVYDKSVWHRANRMCVANALERYLGPPGAYDHMSYKI